MPSPAVLTQAGLADALQVDVTTVRRWTRERRIPALRIGGTVRYVLADVLAATTVPAVTATSEPALIDMDAWLAEQRAELNAQRAAKSRRRTKQKASAR